LLSVGKEGTIINMPAIVILRQAVVSEEPSQEVIVTGLDDYVPSEKTKKTSNENAISKCFRLFRKDSKSSSSYSTSSSSSSSTRSGCTFTVEDQDEAKVMAMANKQLSEEQQVLQLIMKKTRSLNAAGAAPPDETCDAKKPSATLWNHSRSQPILTTTTPITTTTTSPPKSQQKGKKDDSLKLVQQGNTAGASPLNLWFASRSYSNWCVGGNHLMVNRERHVRGLSTLKRSRELDARAKAHAVALAKNGRHLYHSVQNLEQLQQQLGNSSHHVGENIFSGKSIRKIHVAAMKKGTSSRFNILRPAYTEFGMGTAVVGEHHDNGGRKLYMVQLFRGGDQKP
jgi:hypothetical protein